MKIYRIFILVYLSFFNNIMADEHNKDFHCSGNMRILQIVERVLEHSPEYKISKFEIGAMEGKKRVAAYLFPSNPYLTVTQAGRKGSGGDFLNPENGIFFNGEVLVS